MFGGKFDNAKAKRRAKENESKSKKRKVERDPRSCLSLTRRMLPGEKGVEVKMKIEHGDFSLHIATAQYCQLGSKIHRVGHMILLGKVLPTDQAKLFAEYQLRREVCCSGQKEMIFKDKKWESS